MKLPKFGKLGRYTFCILLLTVIFLGYELRLFQWQVIEGDQFAEQALSDRTDIIELEASRGQIFDRNGKVLAGNRTHYNIVYNALEMVYEERNATILKVIDLLEEREEKWRDELPIVLDENSEYQFAEDKEEEIADLKELLNLADYATADECIAELAERYRCEGFSTEDTRTVASVRYSMEQDGYSRTNPYVIAEDVSAETVGIVSQKAEEWKGIEPEVAVTRYYGEDGSLAPHVVGHVGSRSEAEYEEAKKNGTAYDYKTNISGYKWADTMGRGGFEGAFEKELRGDRGQKTIYTDDTGAVKDIAVTVQPKEGNTVYTTLDSDLQRVANLSLKKNIESNSGPNGARDCTSGAVVVLDVKDFGVLVDSSYPTYDMNRYTSDGKYVSQLENDKTKPLLNRALDGAYVPGSVFKPMVALASLQEGAVGADTTFFCDKVFEFGEDMVLKCTDYHGNTNVYGGLAYSCNEYFCNVGLKLTIKTMDAYAEFFGLGEETGVELGEATGTMSNPQDYQIAHGEPWPLGVTAHAAIGQADNMFTPIQLATYCATMANGGKRLKTHFLSKVTDYSGEEVLEEYEPVELFDAGLSSDVLGVVRDGMIGCATYGTASGIFWDYPVSIACKTGTAETSENPDSGGTQANLSFICYAPAEDPEIAIAVMLEYGNRGYYAQNIAKDILDQYFGYYTWDEEGNRYNQNGDMVDDEDKVLKTKAELDAEKAKQEAAEKQEFLSSALEDGGESSNAPEPSTEPSTEPSAEPSPESPGRGDIPTTPFTGETSDPPEGSPAPASPAPEGGSSGKKPDSPYYTDGG